MLALKFTINYSSIPPGNIVKCKYWTNLLTHKEITTRAFYEAVNDIWQNIYMH